MMVSGMDKRQPSDKTALVTGGAAGIGWETACVLAETGTQVFICSRPGESLDNAANKIKAAGFSNIECFAADVSSESDMNQLFRTIGERVEHLDYLVNNAGIDSFCDLDNFSLKAFQHVMDVNVSSVFLAVSEALPLMRKSSAAAIVNVGSIHGHVTTAGRTDYVTSKTALIGATRSMALDLATDRIRVNQVSPGVVETPMLNRAWAKKAPHIPFNELKQRAGKHHPTGRIGQPRDIAKAIEFLLSENAGFITGTDVLVDGGLHAKLAISSIWEN